ncbi:unnamed protein product [Soboliphyme baturini]|uniref:Pru domain-containing protein n=1 Tax=Soboliphyme baturini TaxID=241478 RepID=A0A183IVR7_9BILA|nr:unnamed protein product [Soboliphyme baturini]
MTKWINRIFFAKEKSVSHHLIEFRAGKMFMRGTTVYADKRKGLVYIHQSNDSLMHFCWKDRSTGTVEDVRFVLLCHCVVYMYVNVNYSFRLKLKLDLRIVHFFHVSDTLRQPIQILETPVQSRTCDYYTSNALILSEMAFHRDRTE